MTIADVVSADDMGDLPNANLAEALSGLAGLNAVRNQTTGEGDRITVRGLSSEYNNYSVNGVTLGGAGSPQDRFYRGLRLSFLSPEGIDRIAVHKTVRPNMDADTIGGTIDIRTSTAFDFGEDFSQLSLQGRLSSKHPDDMGAATSGAISRRFNEAWGLYATGFYERGEASYERVGDNGDHQPPRWYPQDAVETVDGWDYGQFEVPGWELGAGDTLVERWGVNGSLHWREEASSVRMRGQYNAYREDVDKNLLSLRMRPGPISGRFEQAAPEDPSLPDPSGWRVLDQTEALGVIYGRFVDGGWQGDVGLGDVVDRDEDGMISAGDATCISNYSLCGASGVWDPQEFEIRREWNFRRNSGVLLSFDVDGETRAGPLLVEYGAAYSESRDKVDADYLAVFETQVGEVAGGGLWYGNEGFSVSNDGPRYPYFHMNAAGHAAIHDPSEYLLDEIAVKASSLTEQLGQAALNLSYEVGGGWIEGISAGVKLKGSRRASSGASIPFDTALLDRSTYADFSSAFGASVDGLFGGRYVDEHRLGQTLDSRRMTAAIAADFGRSQPRPEVVFSYEEDTYAAFLATDLRLAADTDAILGVRVEYTHFAADQFAGTEVTEALYELGQRESPYDRIVSGGDYTRILPSAHIKHWFQPNLIGRAAAWTSYSRPSIERSTRGLQVSYDKRDPVTDERLTDPRTWRITRVEIGNPDIEPADSYNLDASLDWYPDDASAYALAAFFKDIRKFQVRGSSSVIRRGASDTPEDVESLGLQGVLTNPLAENVEIYRTRSGANARIWGIELSARQQFKLLPAPLDGFGAAINATFQQSRAETGISWHPDDYRAPFFETPEWLLNTELYWAKGGWEAYLSYSYQSSFLEDYEHFGNNPYEQEYSFVDISIQRTFADGGSVALQIQNVFDSHTYWYAFGKDPGRLRAYVRNSPIVYIEALRRF